MEKRVNTWNLLAFVAFHTQQEPSNINLKNDINKVERWGPFHSSAGKKAALKGIRWRPIAGIKLLEKELQNHHVFEFPLVFHFFNINENIFYKIT